ncbi:MAG: hypothetical protein H6713_21005 [Myxococcales bacterium]|nr:hypothetical protein [Myxococcales bacterium]MCB9752441.1 hypothetical protein [Myxococcales bacterium]
MTEIAQLIEAALQQNRANLLRKAAINTVAKMPPTTKLRELLDSEAGASIRELTIDELREALGQLGGEAPPEGARSSRRKVVALARSEGDGETTESREARLYRDILVAVQQGPLTIGQLAKQVVVDVAELRGYLAWMKKMGKIASSGRARATRYHAPA